MLPVGDRPVIDYVVEDCIRAGCEEIIFVVGEDFSQLRRYYGNNLLLETYLADKGKVSELKEIQQLAKKARFRYVIQDQHQPYGTAVPVWLARYLIDKDEQFLLVFGDQFFYRTDGGSEIADFVKTTQKAKTPASMLVSEVSWNDVHQYGIVQSEVVKGQEVFRNIVEKPSREDSPSNLSNSSCFVFGSDIFPYLETVINRETSGERFLTDALNAYSKKQQIAVIRGQGEFLDCGNTEGWLHTNNRVLGQV